MKELKEGEEVLIGDMGETEPDFKNKGKSKKLIRLLIFSILILIIIAIVVILVLLLKKDDKKEEEPEKKVEDTTEILMDDSDFIKPNNTIKKYQLIKVKNSHYKFILVHDPKTLNGGIFFRTNFGFNTEILDDFAHYAEHIFFWGTEKITELDLFNLITQFDEYRNAYTSNEETVFEYFGSNYTYDTLLDYISNFIQKPLLNKTFLKTEIDVVTSEYDGKNNTFINLIDLILNNSNPENSFSQTISGHIGNKNTLGNISIDVMAEYLRNYYKLIFNPENCIFLLYSSKSLEDMKNYAEKYFDFKLGEPTAEFKELFNIKVKALGNPIFLDGQLGKIASFNSLIETPKIYFNFIVSQENGFINWVNTIFNYFLGKTEGSLMRFLIEKNYASFYSVENFLIINKNNNIGEFEIYLTKDGCQNIDKVIEAFFASINIMKNDENFVHFLDDLKKSDKQYYQNIEEKQTVIPYDIDNLLYNNYYYGSENMLGNPFDLSYNRFRVKEFLDEITPEKMLIIIDSNEEIKSEYLTSEDILITNNYKMPYRINNLTDKMINKLKNIISVDGYEFKVRSKIEGYTNLTGLTEQPCYEKTKPYQCQYNEYDPNNETDYIPYTVKNENNILSLMKIDRSYHSPFVKGYIEIGLDKNKIEKIVNSNETLALYYLMKLSFYYNVYFSDLTLSWNEINLDPSITPSFTFMFSTFNDVLDKVIQYIIDFFNSPIDEVMFNSTKEYYYFKQSNLDPNSIDNLRNGAINIFKRFISVDTFQFNDFPLESVFNLTYSDYLKMFNNMKNLTTELKLLLYGDISLEKSQSTTNKLSSLINESEINLLLSTPKKVELQEKTSILYSTKSLNKYQRQGITLVMYEYNENLKKQMKLYSLCASQYFFDYIRVKRGSGYTVNCYTIDILDKNYLLILSVGKKFSPEKMDRFINEAIKESFTYKKCQIDNIIKHLENKQNLNYYADKKLEQLISYMYSHNFTNTKVNLKNNNMTYESIIEDLQDVFVNKPKRISILNHRGDITDEELDEQKKELDLNYFLNTEIENYVTEKIDYLQKYAQ